MKRPWIAYSALGLAVLLGLSWMLKRSDWLSDRLRLPIEQGLADASGRRVHVGGVGAALSGWLWLHDVSLGPDPHERAVDVSLTARAVGLKVDLFDLLRGQVSMSSLRAVQVDAPTLYLLRREAPAEAEAAPAAAPAEPFKGWQQRLQGLPLPPLDLDIVGGQAWDQLLGHAPRLVVEDLGLRADPRADGGLRLSLQGRLPGGGRLELWGHSGAAWQGMEATLRLREVELSRLGLVPSALTVTAGRFSGELTAQPRPGGWPAGLGLKGSGRIEGVAISRLGRPGLEQLGAVWRLQGPQLNLEGLQARAWDGRLAGEGRLDLAARSISATVTLKDAQMAGLLRLAGASDKLGLEGRADMALGVMGLLSGPAFAASLKSPAALWQGHPLTGLVLAVSLNDGVAKADGVLDWDGGHGLLSLRATGGELEQVSFKATALPADWLQALVDAPLEGRLDGEALYQRGADGGLGPWQVSLHAPKVRLRGRELLKASLLGSGDARSARLRLDTDLPQWPQLSLQAEALRQHDGVWSLRNTRLLQKGRSLATAHGSWRPGTSGTAQALMLMVKSGALELGQLPLPPAFKPFQGSVQAEGQLAFDGQAWRGSLQAAAPDLRRDAVALPLSFGAHFGPEGVSVTALTLRHGELRATIWAPDWEGPWDGQVALDKASLAALASLAPAALPLTLSGTASGAVGFSQAGRSLTVKLDLREPAPEWLPQCQLLVDAQVLRGALDLRDLKVTQAGGGSLTAQGVLDWEAKAPWKGEARWQALKVAKGSSSGRLRWEGGNGSEGRLALDPWDVGGQPLPAVQAVLGLGSGGLEQLRLQWGATVRASLRHDNEGWQARVDMDGADPAPLAELLLGEKRGSSALRLRGYAEAGPLGLTQPAGVRGQLGDAAQPGSRVQWMGHWAPGQGLDGKGAFEGWDLARLGAALRELGLPAPELKGMAQGDLVSAAGAVTVNAQVDGLAWLDMDFGPAQASLGWSHGRGWINHFAAGGNGPQLMVDQADFGPLGDGWAAHGDVKAKALSLAIFDVDLDAHLDLLQGAGQGSLRVEAHQLTVGVRRWQGLAVDLDWGKGRWNLRERGRRPAFEAKGAWGQGVFTMAEVKARSGGGSGTFHGTVGPGKALDLGGEAQGMEAGDLAGMMGWDQDWHGTAYGTLTVQGTTDKARTVVNAKLEDGSVDGLPFDLATGLVRQQDGWVDLAPVSPIRLTRRSGVALEVTGKVPLESPTAPGLDVRAELKQGGLGLFAGLPGIAAAEGPLELSLRFRGRRNDPQVDGQLKVSGGKITPDWMFPPLEKVELLAQMEDGRVQLQLARGQVQGDGPLVRLELTDPKRPAFLFEHWQPAAFNLRLRASASGLPVRSNHSLRFLDGIIYPDLRLSGSWAEPSLDGSVELVRGGADKALVTWPATFDPPSVDDGTSILDRLKLGLVLVARRDVLVRTEAAQAFVDTGPQGLVVSGSPQSRSLQGRLRLTQGSVDYLLASFKLASDHESSIEMRGVEPPMLDLWGVKDVTGAYLYGENTPRDVQVRLHAFGPLGKVDMRLESDASDLSQSQLASLTGLGVDASDPRNQGGFARLLGKLPASLLTRWARRSGVVDEVGVRLPVVEDAIGGQRPTPGAVENVGQVQPTPSSGTARSLVELSVGKYLGESLYLGVNGRVDSRPSGVTGNLDPAVAVGGKVEYRLKNNARLSGEYSQDPSGNEEKRVMLERSSRFENYNPQRRRWDEEPMITPTPWPSPQPTPTMAPGPVPQPVPKP